MNSIKVALVFVLALIFVGCNPSIKSPVRVENKYFAVTNDGTIMCSLRIETYQEGWGALYTTYTTENCQYNIGDILK